MFDITHNRNSSMESMTALEKSGYGIFRGEKVEEGVVSYWHEIGRGVAFIAAVILFSIFIVLLPIKF